MPARPHERPPHGTKSLSPSALNEMKTFHSLNPELRTLNAADPAPEASAGLLQAGAHTTSSLCAPWPLAGGSAQIRMEIKGLEVSCAKLYWGYPPTEVVTSLVFLKLAVGAERSTF